MSNTDPDKATDHAKSTAKQFLTQIQSKPSAVEEFEGDLILEWSTESRSVVLIFPASNSRPIKLYRETVLNNQATNTEMLSDPTPETANEWVRKY